MRLNLSTSSAQHTLDLGSQIGQLLCVGDLVLLIGELGAGKTALTQGLAAGLGVTQRVTSPTFVLAKKYQSQGVGLLHIDAYRLNSLGEIDDLGIEAALEHGVVVVEWGEAVSPAYQPTVVISISGQDNDRQFAVNLLGDGAAARAEIWAATLSAQPS